MAEGSSIYTDIENYDLTQSSEEETPPPKRKADVEAMATNSSCCFQPETTCCANPQATPKKEQAAKPGRKARGPPPTEGYIYGFELPFTVDKNEYCVVKIGMTAADGLVRRLRDHNSEFKKATGIVPIFDGPTLATTTVDVITTSKCNDQAKVFLISHIKDGLATAESGARDCIGVAPFNIEPTFKRVFPDSKRVTTTEWVIARKQVKEDIQAQFRENKLDSFELQMIFWRN